jgi:hypothetical protein
MASQALTLYNKERALSFAREYLGREEARLISTALLPIMPPLLSNGYSNGGDPLKLKSSPTKSARKAQPKKMTGGTTASSVQPKTLAVLANVLQEHRQAAHPPTLARPSRQLNRVSPILSLE